ARLPGAGAGRTGRRRGVRSRPRARVAPPARRPAPAATARRDAGGERRADGRRRRGPDRRRVPGQPPRRPPDPPRLHTPPPRPSTAYTPRPRDRRAEGALPQGKLRAVVEYVDGHLDADLTLGQMAAAAHLSASHFARRFKAATGQPPHQYVIARRVERARQL